MTIKARYIEFSEKGKVAVSSEDVSTEGLKPWEVVVRNESSLVSAGTELSRLHDVLGNGKYPMRTGYASVGRVVAKGSAVEDFKEGDRVFYAGKHASAQRFTHGQNHQWGRLYPVPEAIAVEDAPFVCLAEIAMTAPCITPLDLGDTVAVFGLGLVGNLAAQLYQIMGARVIGLDPVKKRCELARAVGLPVVVDAPPDRQIQAVKDLTGGRGAEVTVDAVGHSGVIANCVEATALYGQVALLGTPRAPHPGDLTTLLGKIHTNGLVVRGAHMWRFPAAELREAKQTVPWGYRVMFSFMESGRLNIAPLRSHFVRPDEAPRMYDGLKNDLENFWGVVFDWR